MEDMVPGRNKRRKLLGSSASGKERNIHMNLLTKLLEDKTVYIPGKNKTEADQGDQRHDQGH